MRGCASFRSFSSADGQRLQSITFKNVQMDFPAEV